MHKTKNYDTKPSIGARFPILLRLDRFKKPKNFPIVYVIINDFDNLQISGYGKKEKAARGPKFVRVPTNIVS